MPATDDQRLAVYARNAALRRLELAHPDEFTQYYAEERKKRGLSEGTRAKRAKDATA